MISGSVATGIAEAAEVLHHGGLVAFPTETVYGLGADAFNPDAVAKVFRAKGRPTDNPLIVHISDIQQLYDIGKNISSIAQRLIEAFFPGPLTLVIEHRGQIPAMVTAGLPTVAVRMPNHPVALALIEAFGKGIIGPSANLSGKPSPTTAQHVYHDLNGKVDIILDAGATTIGIESTVLDITTSPPTILRLGGLSRTNIEQIIGEVQTTSSAGQLKRSPGTRYRHYAPSAFVELLNEGDQQHAHHRIEYYHTLGKSIGCIIHSLKISTTHLMSLQSITKEEYAHRLFDLLRKFDEIGVDIILVECIPDTGIGEAVMDRLRKASER